MCGYVRLCAVMCGYVRLILRRGYTALFRGVSFIVTIVSYQCRIVYVSVNFSGSRGGGGEW